MSTRRGFFALIGNATVSGLVATRASAKVPTLILPPAGLLDRPASGLGAHLLLDSHKTQMHAFIAIGAGMPDEAFLDWMEGGLRQVEAWKPGGVIRRAYEMDLAAGRDPWGRS